MKTRTTLSACALAAVAVVGAVSSPAAALELVPFDQATIVDRDAVILAAGGLLTADGTNLCAVDPGSIAFADGTYACFIDGGSAVPGARLPINTPVLVPRDEATVVDPSTVTVVPGGLITAEGTDLCVTKPGRIVFPDGRYPCFINYVLVYETLPTPEEGLYDTPQVAHMPVGGADTGVEGEQNSDGALMVTLLGLGLASVAVVGGRRTSA